MNAVAISARSNDVAKPILIDFYCGAGGASAGYAAAGFDVMGVDNQPQPNYPYPFLQADALETLQTLRDGGSVMFRVGTETRIIFGHDVVAKHGSPPCQRYSGAAAFNPGSHNKHPDLLAPTRALFQELNRYITLCGSHFDLVAPDVDGVLLQMRRHRQFEASFKLTRPGPCNHREGMVSASVFGYGGAMSPEYRDSYRRTKGYVPALSVLREIMDAPWMNKREISESIPPRFAQFIGSQLMAEVLDARTRVRECDCGACEEATL